ncbi:MAG TPA: sodium/solute symporter [Prosthecobacter sp.]
MTHFSALDYTLFLIYLIASVLVGLLFVKEQRTMKDFFLAGRSMGSVVVAISVMAAMFSGISYLGGPAEVYKNGLGFGWVLFSFFIATPVTTIFILPFFYKARFITAYQYLEERFSLPARLLASGLFILRVLLWLGAATYAPALALEQATGLPLQFSILATGVLTTVYTMMGGMKAVIWTDVMQFGVLFGGQVVILLVALDKIPGGMAEVLEVAKTHGQALPSSNIDLTTRVSWLGIILGGAVLNLVQMATDQVAVQRYMTAKDVKTAQRGLWYKLAVTIPVLGLFYGTGSVLRAYYNHVPDPLATNAIKDADQILPWFVVHELPSGMAGVLIAAIFAASMSTISAGLNSLASATMIDFQQRLSTKPLPPDEKQIFHARLWTLLYGGLVIALAFLVSRLGTLVEATNTVIGLVGGPILGMFLSGIFIRRISSKGILIGTVFGFALSLAAATWRGGTPIMEAGSQTPEPAKISFIWLTTIGCAATMLLAWVLSFVFPGKPASELKGLTWQQRDDGE